MLSRCHDPKYQKNFPTYIGCSVVDEWLTFTNFKSWMIEQDWEGLQLDKDIISPGNKVYGPETCCFVTHAVNNLLTDSAAARGKSPQGVSFHKKSGKFLAKIKIYGRNKHLGLFTNPEAASAAYIKAKSKHIFNLAQDQSDLRIKSGLIKHAKLIGVKSNEQEKRCY